MLNSTATNQIYLVAFMCTTFGSSFNFTKKKKCYKMFFWYFVCRDSIVSSKIWVKLLFWEISQFYHILDNPGVKKFSVLFLVLNCIFLSVSLMCFLWWIWGYHKFKWQFEMRNAWWLMDCPCPFIMILSSPLRVMIRIYKI